MKFLLTALIGILALASLNAADPVITAGSKSLPLPGEAFKLDGRDAFVILPPGANKDIPWVWYAPTLRGLPGKAETWMFERFLKAGIAIAGVDVGESYGSPDGRKIYSAFHEHLVEKRGFATKACLLARSRGGLMLYCWAAENPDKVNGVAGLYPVCNITSYPGLKRACGAYGLSAEELEAELPKHNPVDRLATLATAKVPIHHMHGDKDGTVPLDANSGLLAERYKKLGGTMTLEVVQGGGHNMDPHWFQSQPLVDFVLACTGTANRAEPPLNIITYNIRNDTAGDKGPRDWAARKDKVAAYLLNPEPDIIGLQEVKHNQLLDLVKALPGYAHVGIGRDDGKTAGEYSPIFYKRQTWKLNPKEHGTYWLSDTPGVVASRSWGNSHNRICTWARLTRTTDPGKGSSIYVYNTHWDHRSQPARVKSGELMLKTLKARSHQDDPVILMGDLNATTENPAVKHLLDSGLLVDHGEKQMKSSSQWKAELVPGLRIDHIFVSPSVGKASLQVESNGDAEDHAGSDHHPVRLSVPERSP